MHQKQIFTAGKTLREAEKALIMLHGRGGSSGDILSLSSYFDLDNFALIAPQATNRSWYPNSFLAEPEKNEPWLSSALLLLNDIVNDIVSGGMTKDKIYFLGFSQGACLTLEYTCRYPVRWGGIVAFSGGLIGDRIYRDHYKGDFSHTPVFMGSSDPDPHVPVDRVRESAEILNDMNASVNIEIYKNLGHTISQDEIDKAKRLIFS